MWTPSRVSRRPSPSNRRPPPATPLHRRHGDRNPRTTCACCGRRWACPTGPDHRIPIQAQTVEQMVDRVLALPEGTRFMVLAPRITGRKGEYRKLFEQMVKEGFVRARVDGEVVEAAAPPELAKNSKHHRGGGRSAVGARGYRQPARRFAGDGPSRRGRPGPVSRRSTATRSCSRPTWRVPNADSRCRRSRRGCSPSTRRTARAQSVGAGIPARGGSRKLVLDPERSIAAGALAGVGAGPGSWYRHQIEQLGEHLGFDLRTPWRQLPTRSGRSSCWGPMASWTGCGRAARAPTATATPSKAWWHGSSAATPRTTSEEIRRDLERHMSFAPCHACRGARLRPEAWPYWWTAPACPRLRPCPSIAPATGSPTSPSANAT
jgi:excinuclease ABC subunit A